jgi:hypothetical protein
MSVLSFTTSYFSPRLVVRNKRTMRSETKCPPFCKKYGKGLVRGKARSYLTLVIPEDCEFDKYLRMIQSEMMHMLVEVGILTKHSQPIVKMPYDIDTHILQIKLPMSHGRLNIECFDKETIELVSQAR